MRTLWSILSVAFAVAALAGPVAAAPMTFDTNPVLSNTQAPGAWYTDRFNPAVFQSTPFLGDNRLQHGIRAGDYQGVGSFYNYQGRKFDTNLVGAQQSFSIDLYVGANWANSGVNRNAGMWATGFDGNGGVSAYPIMAYRNSTGVTPGFYSFDYINGGWDALAAGNLGQWNHLEFVLTVGQGMQYLVNGALVGGIADPDTVSLGNVILNAYNFGADYDVYWDNFDAKLVPEPSSLATMSVLLAACLPLAWRCRRRSAR